MNIEGLIDPKRQIKTKEKDRTEEEKGREWRNGQIEYGNKSSTGTSSRTYSEEDRSEMNVVRKHR